MKYAITYEIRPEDEGKNAEAIMKAIRFAVPHITSNLGQPAAEGAVGMMGDLLARDSKDLQELGAACAAAAKNFEMMAECIFGCVLATDPEWQGLDVTPKQFLAVLMATINKDVDEVYNALDEVARSRRPESE